MLTRKPAARSTTVTGVDRSPEMIRLARAHRHVPGNVVYRKADYLTDESLPEAAYDFVSAVAVVHHAPFEQAVTRLAWLTAPGDRLTIVGMAANRTLLDWLISACGVPVSLLYTHRHGGKHSPAGMPMEDVHMSWTEIRRALRRLLPGCDVRRTLLWRYVAVWDKPREGGP
ncbi:class I SAM-dependent methyltransferase [Streptomyces indiaensis]|nr:class I SAM-dependent methyltransferase [Streptomyces indiaensis]